MRHLARRTALALIPALALLAPLAARAQPAPTPIRFALDWTPSGYHAPWALAEDRGLFARENLAVRTDRGYGSGDTIAKVAAGAYDIGFADINGLVRFDAENPTRRVIAVYMVFERSPASVVTLRRTGIRTAADLRGRTLGAPEGEAGRVLFPVYAAATGLDPASVRWTSMQASLRESMLATGQVDAIAGLTMSTVPGLWALHVPREDVVVLSYADAGVDLYGSAIITSAAWAEAHPEALRGFLRATLAGTRLTFADPAAGIAALVRREPLMDPAVELERLAITRDITMLTEGVRRDGYGTMTAPRMARVVEANARVWNIATPPAPEQIYSTAYLPPEADRRP